MTYEYEIEFTELALNDIERMSKAGEIQALKKIDAFLDELKEHPYTGTGKPKPLKGNRVGQWSRRISDKHRLVYSVDDNKIVVLIISAYSHYNDK
jgi:toxin YoeB